MQKDDAQRSEPCDVDTAGTITVNEQADARGARPRLLITTVWRNDLRLGAWLFFPWHETLVHRVIAS
jgi:hypothetical protein